MSKPTIVEYNVDQLKAIKAITAVIARLGYTLGQVDRENGIVTFETGMSMRSYAGQKMSAQISDFEEAKVQITISGVRKTHGAQVQVYDWGEANKIAAKIIEELDVILGTGTVVGGTKSSEGCFIATAVYQDYDHPQVLKLRKFRDDKLKKSLLGRAFIRLYYRAGQWLQFCHKDIHLFVQF